MSTTRMNAYDLYVRCKGKETFNARVNTKYNEIKQDIEESVKAYFYNRVVRFFQRKIGEYSEQDLMPTILDMLREDGFCITESSYGAQGNSVYGDGNNYVSHVISWGSDIPAVQFALDGPKYNENIIT